MNSANTIEKVVCVIPARYASTRLPGKPLLPVNGKPLVMWTYERAVKSGAFDGVYVATDDDRIRGTVEQSGGHAIMTAGSHISGTDRIREAIQGLECGYVVNLQGDEPMVPVDLLQEFSIQTKNLDSLSLLTCVAYATIEEMQNQNVVKAVLTAQGDALYFSRSPIPYFRGETDVRPYKHMGIYGFSRASIETFCSYPAGRLEQIEKLEQLRALEFGMKIHCLVRDYQSIGIDTQQDLEAFRLCMK